MSSSGIIKKPRVNTAKPGIRKIQRKDYLKGSIDTKEETREFMHNFVQKFLDGQLTAKVLADQLKDIQRRAFVAGRIDQGNDTTRLLARVSMMEAENQKTFEVLRRELEASQASFDEHLRVLKTASLNQQENYVVMKHQQQTIEVLQQENYILRQRLQDARRAVDDHLEICHILRR